MIKVASYNIRKAIGTDRVRRPERIMAVIEEIDADIVALQEADRRFGTRSSAIPPHLFCDVSGWRAVPFETRMASIGWHGNAILVKSDVVINYHRLIELPRLEPRGAVMAEVSAKGAEFRIVGMHLDLSGLWRKRQIRAILAAIAARPRMPTILMGDLNEWSPHGGCFVEFAHNFRIAPTPPSFHSRRPIARLDRILADPSLHIAECGVHHSPRSRSASDHLPVWAKVELAA